jgi:peptidoglycan/xylan/chitin deacetylase (PgdA/CDA1 family)
MQEQGMRLGGHTHRHEPLASLSPDQQRADLSECARLLSQRLASKRPVPFSYPYGKSDSFTAQTQQILCELGFACGFSTEVGDNVPGDNPLALRRVDTKDCTAEPRSDAPAAT